ncbi:Glycoside hydrolase, 38 vacuolar alpha mannosidase [Microbotryomycetes sp. JL221]|nr:Glycoside hydrolase, 38 vacuolar alpha mannosidase [Microbotryomycetes sp. JL221]
MAPPLYPVRSTVPQPMHFRGLTLGRLDHFDNSPYGGDIRSVLFTHRTDDIKHVQLEVWSSPGKTKTPFDVAVRQKFKPAQKGMLLGPSWTHHWLRVTLTLPQEWIEHDYERIQFEFDPSCEAMIFNTEGLSLQGITGGYGIDRRVEFILDPKKRKGTYKLYIEVSCNGMFGNGSPEVNDPPDPNRMFRLNSADLVVPNMEAWRLMWDMRTIRDLARALPENSVLGNKCMEVGNAIMNTFKVSDRESIAKCRKLAEKVFGQGWEELGHKIYKSDPAEASTWGIGNCHIDTAWLWPYSATRQKSARSWSTQLDLMDRYPEHRFVASQAQQFFWLEQDYPQLFDKIKGRVESGDFQSIGATWVEMDTNMPSGEALCRQFLYGQRFFKHHFGKYTRTFWLPDSFGYSSQLPQLCRLAGCDFFFTQKLSWSQFNKPVHTSFRWVGQDSSQIVVHMTPVDTYTAQASVDDVLRSINNHKSLQSGAPTALLAFGNGDGGGGPLAPMLENLRRCRAVANHSGELPKVTMGQSVDGFYDDMLKKTDNGKTLPTWNGELYLELHRGTATSHGSIKRGNRKSEILLREVEYAGTLASIWPATKSKYRFPKDEVDPLWHGVLLNQFHDVLPGSGIGLIYEDAEKIYAETAHKGKQLLDDALSALVPDSVDVLDSNAEGDELIAINTTPFARREIVKIPLASARALADTAVQTSHDGQAYALIQNELGSPVVTASSIRDLAASDIVAARARVTTSGYSLSNGYLEVSVSKTGRITSIIDRKLKRELIQNDHSAGFVIFEDRPLNWDAWDVDLFHLETKSDIDASSVHVVEDGPLRASLAATYRIGNDTTIKAIISLDAVPCVAKEDALTMIRYDVEVDWHERHQFLKWELPLQISSEFATFENQFGFCQRPTHRNTTWDRAKFEVVGHKFADLSEFGYGVALLNDCKYGYAAEGSTLRLSLLRAATSPDAEQDQGSHVFSFAVLPHRGSFAESDVPVAGWLFNQPHHLRRLPRSSLAQAESVPHPFTLHGSRNIILDTIKRAEDDHFSSKATTQTVILRLYEAFGGHGEVTLNTSLPVESATICDILERDLEELSVLQEHVSNEKTESSFKLSFRGFQVVTVKVTLSASGKPKGGLQQWVAV